MSYEQKRRVKPTTSRAWTYWSDPTWRDLRMCQLVIVAMLLVLLLLYFSGVSSVLYPLATAVILNIVAASVSFPAVSRSGTGMAPLADTI